MAIYFGNDNIKEIYVGSDIIREVYYGSEKVWEGTDGYWVHKDTGVKTYFGLDASFISNRTMTSTSWRHDCSEIKLPLGVTGLANNCFYGCFALTSITLPEGVTSLGQSCFYGCSSLTSITLPESMYIIQDYCFDGCFALTSINIPEGITSLGKLCFFRCTSLTSITLPESINNIQENCFSDCSSLTSITIPESVTSIGNGCFSGCTSLTLATVLPATPPTLGAGAFSSVHTSFSIKVRSPYINAYTTATNWVAYADKISLIEETANDGYWVSLSGAKTYFWIDDPSIVGGIMNSPPWFRNCSEVKLPLGVTGLGDNLFRNSFGISSITIPESVTSIGNGCFQGCSNFTLATVLPAIPPTLGTNAFSSVHASFNIKVRPPYVDDYKTATSWISFASKISAI